MPTHAHLVVFDADYDKQRLQNSISAMGQYTGRQLAGYCGQNHRHHPQPIPSTLVREAGLCPPR